MFADTVGRPLTTITYLFHKAAIVDLPTSHKRTMTNSNISSLNSLRISADLQCRISKTAVQDCLRKTISPSAGACTVNLCEEDLLSLLPEDWLTDHVTLLCKSLTNYFIIYGCIIFTLIFWL